MGDKDSAARQPHVATVAGFQMIPDEMGRHGVQAQQGRTWAGYRRKQIPIIVNAEKAIETEKVTKKCCTKCLKLIERVE